jgi:GTP cyclohydrolase I
MSEHGAAIRAGSLQRMSVGGRDGTAAAVGRDGTAAAAGRVRRVVDPSRIDLPAAERAAADLLRAIGADLDAPDLVGTPRRVAASLAELLTPVEFSPTTFANEGNYDELVLVRDIEFQSLCMHHMLPFIGQAHVAYLPGDRIIGLSKLARVVEMFARDLQLQERMTVQIADWLDRELSPRGVGVVLSAEHTCMTIRGVRKPGAKTVTSALRGALRDDPRTRQELLSLAG